MVHSRGLPARSDLTRRWSAVGLGCALGAGALCLGASGAGGAPVSASAGYAYVAGPSDRVTRNALVVGSVSPRPGFQASVGGMRYDDNQIGEGIGLIGGLGLPLAPLASLRAWGYRYVGDGAFRAWRVKAGPELSLPPGATLGLYYSHYEDDTDLRSDAAIGELAVPLAARTTGRMSASYAAAGGDPASTQGSIGLGWTPFGHFELSGEVGVARNGWTTAPFPTRRHPLLPILGGGGTSSDPARTEGKTESTFLVGATAFFP